ncbi:PTS transporter subunit EIIC [Olsenella uli]|uniref:PTS transporter subunit EIIC n=1 Tax=Olsenella uli TaxID=133926 RepID=UPI0024204922|nr:PTS transporter subunit EIIC [Olsenella uli]
MVDLVGGKSNVSSVAHCITRVRFKLKDESKANDERLTALDGIIKVMHANGQYQVVVGNIVEDVYDSILRVGGFADGGPVDADEDIDAPKGIAAVAIDLISGIFQPILGTFSAAGIMKGLLALVVFLWPSFGDTGAHTTLYTIADGMFYFLPVVLAYTASKKFKMSEFTAMAIGFALVYPTMVALTSGEVLGSIELGFLGTFSWYATFFGLPIIMPAADYTSSVIPILVMVWFASKVEAWVKSWIPASLKMFFVPLITMTIAIVLGYLAIGPIASLITNLLAALFELIFNLPAVGGLLGGVIVAAVWMPLVIFGFHWSLVPIAISNIGASGQDFILASIIARSFSLGAVLFAMYLRNKDERFRGICLPAMISSFFFGVTEPAIYGIALPDKRAFVNACIGSACGGVVTGITGAVIYLIGGLGVFSWLWFIDPSGANGMTGMVWAVVSSIVGAIVGFALEFATYKAPEHV